MKKLAILVSGVGSILEAMIESRVPIKLVLADRKCRGEEVAKSAGIKTELLERTFGQSFDRVQYTLDVISVLKRHEINLVVMAGYMTVFAPVMFEDSNFKNRVTNIHPSLLPAFKGDKAVADALAFGVKVTGTTIHLATAELDNGPIMAQQAVPVLNGDTTESLWERIKQVERKIYPETVRKILKGDIKLPD